MATGSGKTFTVATFLDNLFKARDRRVSLSKMDKKPAINILVLNNRINLVNQLHADLYTGRDGKPALLGEQAKNDLTVKLFHSQADEEDMQSDNQQDLEWDEIGSGQDKLYFATLQTAGTKGL